MRTTTRKLTAILLACLMLFSALSAGAESVQDVIMTTGTTQAFTDEPVAEADLTAILQAGLQATSAMNSQPWYFAVVTNQDVMAEIGSSMSFGAPAGGAPAGAPAGMPEGFTPPEGGMPAGAPGGAPAGGVPAMGSGAAKAALGDSPVAIIIYMNEQTSNNASFDCGLACQNMVIAASALGYGTKIVSSTTMALNGANHDALCEKLGVDKAYNAVAVLLVGKTDTVDGATGATVRSDLADKVSFVK